MTYLAEGHDERSAYFNEKQHGYSPAKVLLTPKRLQNSDRAVVEQVESFKFLGVHINNKLDWSKHTKTVLKRARQSLFPLRKLKRVLEAIL